ncbi:gliding-associated putative ABC transporter substrate-binding component GldG [Paludibacter propionicigenes WB4]|uniref:Gliding-associated putative ABC transporter substrate-binding component GldG n=2 Tax=Paludibacter TaxID=346096 RepID=E4T4F5_PALPW|nr:gliding-associated putative ABC transporter substrate-binding component GldG [Paludibacter propionicigenes WB4]
MIKSGYFIKLLTSIYLTIKLKDSTHHYMTIRNRKNLLLLILLLTVIILSYFYFFRLDLTTDKRYSVSSQTKNLMEKIESPLEVVVYLDGDLNPGFQRLKKSTVELLEELSVYAGKNISIKYENPSLADSPEEREKRYTQLMNNGLTPTAVYERDKEGKSIQKIIFPWIEISSNGKKIPVCLLKNILGNSGAENLNISIENLEFEITDGIRRLVNKDVKKIAFLEGHGELTEAETYDISKSLSRYFQIDRGTLASNAAVLNDYKVVIIAKPIKPFSESDKYIIDQYIMNGGRVLWLLDGVRISKENLSTIGLSPAIELDLNLNDQLFRYGIRINSILLQDVQCASVPVNIAPANASPQFEPTPWYFAPLLLASPEHPVSRNITEVRSEFCSGIDVVGNNKQVDYQLLLATSDNTHIIGTPTTIDLSQKIKENDKTYFSGAYVPVAVSMEGIFDSDFANRMTPKGLANTTPTLKQSVRTRQIVVADGDIVRNEVSRKDSASIPLGFDRYMNQQFGNKDFVQNAVLFLADNDGWMQLRSRTIKLRLLNKKIISEDRLFWQLTNVLTPLTLLLLFGIGYQIIRKRKYTRNQSVK